MKYKGRWFIREAVYICGEYLDGEAYPVFQQRGRRRGRCKPTSEIQEKINQRNAEKKLVRLVHTNFTEKDVALHLTYREEVSREEAEKALYNFIRRVKRARQKAGLCPLKYISCTEVGEKNGRVHHHLILSGGLNRDSLEALWGKGYANSRRLQFDDETGLSGLTRYMVKRHESYRRWNGSRNLIRPEAIIRDGRMAAAELFDMAEAIEGKNAHAVMEERHAGFTLIEAEAYRNTVNHGIYVRYEMHWKGNGKKAQIAKRE